jgi:hypothetical protein
VLCELNGPACSALERGRLARGSPLVRLGPGVRVRGEVAILLVLLLPFARMGRVDRARPGARGPFSPWEAPPRHLLRADPKIPE